MIRNENELYHYGTPRHSGRYPWGSGENPYQRTEGFLGRVRKYEDEGMTEVQIAKAMSMSTTQLRAQKTAAIHEERAYLRSEAARLKAKGMSVAAIGRRMGRNESTIRDFLDESKTAKANKTQELADVLRKAVADKKYIDVSAGTEFLMPGVTKTRMTAALAMLEKEGYSIVRKVKFEQLGTGKETKMNVLAPPGTKWADIMQNKDKIRLFANDYYVEDGKITAKERPKAVDSKRIYIRYAEDGGLDRDGTIELRRNVPDISLKDARYAQVRVNVDDKMYLKGMALYSDNIPDGYDIVFNTNKKRGTPIEDVLKPLKTNKNGEIEWDNPFGASIKEEGQKNGLIRAQRHYIDENGKKQLSALNIVQEEGNWDSWNRTLASQFLAKQPPALAERQLNLSYQNAVSEFEEIKSYTNPTVRAKLLAEFADKCDSDATHLQAAALPRQSTKVILPFPDDLKDTEVFAPGYKDGEHVALVRYPHAGTFEIPILTVNNSSKKIRSVIGGAIDAIGIAHPVAERLSGADFDGDSVVLIPCDNVKIKSTPALKGLQGFDSGALYPKYDGMHIMTDHEKGLEMGMVSNLITDMTIKGAPEEDIVRAVRHSMVVIDAKKHELNYKESERVEGIKDLKDKYMGHYNEKGNWSTGASTLLSKSTSEQKIPARKEKAFSFMTDEEKERFYKGEKIYENTKQTYSKLKNVDDNGNKEWEKKLRLEDVPAMMLTDNAMDLVSDKKTTIELIYANYANSMKALAKKARAESRKQKDIERNPSAAKVYEAEVRSLKAKLNDALKNAPFERQAQLLAGAKYSALKYNNPDWDEEHKKRARGMCLDEARARLGASKSYVTFTDKEWEAINNGAISKTILGKLLDNAKPEEIKARAMPKQKISMTPSKIARAQLLLSNGHTQAEVAEILDVSVSTLMKSINKTGEE